MPWLCGYRAYVVSTNELGGIPKLRKQNVGVCGRVPGGVSAILLGAVALLLWSCGDTLQPDPESVRPAPPPTATVPARITLEPEEVAVVAGDTVRVRARVLNDRAQPISDAVVTWMSSDPTVATVDATGLVTSLKEGNTSLTATSGPVSNSATVAVHSLDRATLMDLYIGTRGGEWTNNGGWGTDEPVGSWYGVTANEQSRVTAINLSENGLNGQLPEDLGSLAFLTELEVGGNDNLSGPIPFSLSDLGIQTLNYGGTMLCTVRDEGFQAWLNAVPTREGEFLVCNEERSDLMKLYEAMGGENWEESANWGTDAPLENWYGIAVDSTGRVTEIDLNRNNLSGQIPTEIQYFPHLRLLRLDYNRLEGEIPPEIGLLTELRRMDIDGNQFSGVIPPEIGNLVNLVELWIGGAPAASGTRPSQLQGSIPSQLGNLKRLRVLQIYEIPMLSGPIPEELGLLTELVLLEIHDTSINGVIPASFASLKKLRALNLQHNRLTGPLPAELGQQSSIQEIELNNYRLDGPLPPEIGSLERLQWLSIENNVLSGPVPPAFGDLGNLAWLHIWNNPELRGSLPDELIKLTKLRELIAYETALCAPTEPAFRTWLQDVVARWRLPSCGAEVHAEAHLIQSTQSTEHPVPLVANRSALLRVFVASETEAANSRASIPPVSATFFINEVETYTVDIPAGSSAIPTEVEIGRLDLSANALIPTEYIQPG
ncbi:MAG: hypothetical protein F4Z59_07215 [Gemmatimonadales bacterium]|nr:hypothetical protein [Gemmatimonadales bacterium]